MVKYSLFLLVFVLFIYLVLIMPRILNRPDISHLTGIYYAHRGLHQEKDIAPENSLAAFRLAIENNYGIELDVQITKDKVPVVFHDGDLNRLCGADLLIKDMTFEQLQEFTLYDSSEKIPHFKEVLSLVDGQVPLIVELKAYGNPEPSSSIVYSYLKDYKGPYRIESFNPMVVKWYKDNHPYIVRGQLATKHAFKSSKLKDKVLNFTLRNMMFNFLSKPDFIAYDQKYSHLIPYKTCKTIYKPLTIAYTIKSQKTLDKKWHSFDLFIFEGFTPK